MREAAADGEDVEKVRTELGVAEKLAGQSRQLADAGVRAALIGESLMRSDDIGAKIRELLERPA